VIRFNCPHCGRPHEVHEALAQLPLVCKQCGQRIAAPVPGSVPAPAPPPSVSASPPVAPPVAPPPVVAVPPAPKPSVQAVPKLPVPSAAPAPAPVPIPVVAKAAPAPAKPPPPSPSGSGDDVLVTKPDSSPDIDFNVGGPTAASLSDAARTRPGGLTDANRTRPVEVEAAPAAEPDSSSDINLDLLGPPAPEGRPVAIKPEVKPLAPSNDPPEPKPEMTVLPFVADLVVFVVLIVVGALVGELLVDKPTLQVLSESFTAVIFPPTELLLWGAPPLVLGLIYLLLNSRERTVGAWLRRRAR
jgi:hypothetical protein